MRSSGQEVNIRGYLDLMLEGASPPGAAHPACSPGEIVRRLHRADDHPRRSGDSAAPGSGAAQALPVRSGRQQRRPGHRGKPAREAGINAGTAREYQALFQRMFVLDIVPAWFSNRIKRRVKTPEALPGGPRPGSCGPRPGPRGHLVRPGHARPPDGHLRRRSAALRTGRQPLGPRLSTCVTNTGAGRSTLLSRPPAGSSSGSRSRRPQP